MSKYYCFTINNPNGLLTSIDFPPECTYWCYQEEISSTGTHHLQGYLELSKQYRINTLRTLLVDVYSWDSPHLEPRRGSATQARDYCSKHESRIGDSFQEWGTISNPAQGKRTDLETAMQGIRDGKSTLEMMESFPNEMAKYEKFLNNYKREYFQKQIELVPFTPRRGWQVDESMYLLTPPDTRKINWIWDPIGNTGKSTFAQGYTFDDGKTSLVLGSGKKADLLYLIAQTDFLKLGAIFFDFTREVEERVPYEVMELIKNQRFNSTKYEPCQVILPRLHLYVFANFAPDRSKLSADRWNVREIKNLARFDLE